MARVERWLIATLMAATVLLTLAQVLFRYVLNRPLGWSDELARYCFVWVTFVGAASLIRRPDGHPVIDSLYHHVGPRAQRVIAGFGRLAIVVASLAIAAGGLRLLLLQWAQLSPSIELPMAGVYACMFACPILGLFWLVWTWRRGDVED
jgi:TRAP-type transport system small permease protein